MIPDCCCVITFAHTAPILLYQPQISQLQSLCYPLGNGAHGSAAAGVFVLPSRQEDLGSVLLEAMAAVADCGRPHWRNSGNYLRRINRIAGSRERSAGPRSECRSSASAGTPVIE